MLDAGCWMLDAGCWMLEAVKDAVSNVLRNTWLADEDAAWNRTVEHIIGDISAILQGPGKDSGHT